MGWRRLFNIPMVGDVTEVGPDHPRHQMLESLRAGLQAALTEGETPLPQFQLTADDYKQSQEHNLTEGSSLTSLAPRVFATLRTAFGLGRKSFLASVAPSESPYLSYKTNSSGKHNFFLSHDRRFIFKTEPLESVDFFLSMLEDYLAHLIRNPHSLIVK